MRLEKMPPKLREVPRLPPIQRDMATFPNELMGPMFRFLSGIYSRPGLEDVRSQLFHTIKLVQRKEPGDPRSSDSFYGVLAYAVFNLYATMFGFGPPGRPKEPTVSKIYPADQFPALVEQAQEWHETDTPSVHGGTFGAYDPPHVGHTIDMGGLYRYTSRVFVGVDPEWLIAHRKSKPGDPRPRFPHLFYRMWQFGLLPIVDAVYEIPIEKGDKPRTFFPDLYRKLHLTLQYTEHDHELLPVYREQMKEVGGRVLITNPAVKLLRRFVNFRSTAMMERLARIHGSQENALAIWNRRMEKRDQEIRGLYERYMERKTKKL